MKSAWMATALILVSAAPVWGRGDFELTVEMKYPSRTLYLPNAAIVKLSNLGPERELQIGFDAPLGYYLTVWVSRGSERQVEFFDTSYPTTQATPAPRELFLAGDEVRKEIELFWQEQKPIFNEPGIWNVRVRWRGPDELLYAEPAEVEVVLPADAEYDTLAEELEGNRCIPFLHDSFVRRFELSDMQPRLQACRSLESVRASEYRQAFAAAADEIERLRVVGNDLHVEKPKRTDGVSPPGTPAEAPGTVAREAVTPRPPTGTSGPDNGATTRGNLTLAIAMGLVGLGAGFLVWRHLNK